MGTARISRAGNSGYLISQLSKMDAPYFSKIVSALTNTMCLDIESFLDINEK